MSKVETKPTWPDEEVIWFYDGQFGKLKATALNNYIGVFEVGKWYTMHYLPNGSFWVYRLDEAHDEQTARIHSGTMVREGDYPVLSTSVFTCIGVAAPDHVIVHHTPTDLTSPVSFAIKGALGPIEIKYVH